MSLHAKPAHTYGAYVFSRYFWQNDRDLLRATAVTRGWNGHRNKSQHRKLTLEKKILPPRQQGFEPATFRSRVRRSNHRAFPAPKVKWEKGSRSVKMWCGQLATVVDETGLKEEGVSEWAMKSSNLDWLVWVTCLPEMSTVYMYVHELNLVPRFLHICRNSE